MLRFPLRTAFISVTVVAGLLAITHLAGNGSVAITTLVVGLVIGGCVAFLFRRSSTATNPVVLAVLAAIFSVILGIFLIDFDATSWDNPLGKAPWGLALLFWYAFFGAWIGATTGLLWSKWNDGMQIGP